MFEWLLLYIKFANPPHFTFSGYFRGNYSGVHSIMSHHLLVPNKVNLGRAHWPYQMSGVAGCNYLRWAQ